jgi:hypothetical protein
MGKFNDNSLYEAKRQRKALLVGRLFVMSSLEGILHVDTVFNGKPYSAARQFSKNYYEP